MSRAKPQSIITDCEGVGNRSISSAGITNSGFAFHRSGMKASLPLHLHHFIGFRAAGRIDLDLRALLLADQRAGERRRDGDFAFLGVSLRFADKLPDSFLLGVLIDQRHGCTECDGVAGQLGNVDYLGARKLVFQLGDAALVERLRFFGGVILSVLRKVAMGARVGDLLDDARALHLLAVFELSSEGAVALRRHWNFVHRFQPPESKSDRGPKDCLAARSYLALHIPSLRPPRLLIRFGPEIT